MTFRSIIRRTRGGGRAGTTLVPLLLALAGCAGAAAAPIPAGTPAPDPALAAADLIRATTLAGPRRITFTWTLNEAGSRVNGRGVVRAEAPDRLRLDLFGPRNESYLAAALVGEMYRLPGNVASQVTLPSPAILWGGLGVIRPPTGSTVVNAVSTDSSAALRYRAQDASVYQYETTRVGGAVRLNSVERSAGGGRIETVRLTRDASGRLQRAEYRNWAAFRELTLEFEEVQDAASFPETTWRP